MTDNSISALLSKLSALSLELDSFELNHCVDCSPRDTNFYLGLLDQHSDLVAKLKEKGYDFDANAD